MILATVAIGETCKAYNPFNIQEKAFSVKKYYLRLQDKIFPKPQVEANNNVGAKTDMIVDMQKNVGMQRNEDFLNRYSSESCNPQPISNISNYMDQSLYEDFLIKNNHNQNTDTLLITPAIFENVKGRSYFTWDTNVRDHIDLINRGINNLGEERYKMYGLTEQEQTDWRLFDNRGGDCEDHALTKKNELIKIGIPATAMRIIGVKSESGGADTPDHAVLLLRTDKGDLVLDNLNDDILKIEDSNYKIFAMQDANPHTFSTY